MSDSELDLTVAPEGLSPADDQQLGVGGAAQAANLALLALTRAARSFLVYDARNDAIRGFLQDWKESMQAFAQAYGTLELEVRPFELVYANQVVYLERDRERSLAFRLFRDGVRRLSVSASAPWEEQLRLLEILSIRYTGVLQQEDDIVTLLWKAGFTEIQVEAVEGVVLDGGEESDEPARRGLRIDAPRDRDQPFPALLEGEVRWRVLPIEKVEALRLEQETRHLGSLCVRLIQRMMGAISDPTDPAQTDELIPLVEEIREFMLGEQQLGTLLQLLDLLREGLPPALARPLTRGFASERALSRIVRSIQDSHEAPPDLLLLLDRVPGDHLHTVANLLEKDRDPNTRRINRQLAEHLGRHQPKVLMALGLAAPEGAVTDLLRAARKAAPELCLSQCVALSKRADTELHREIHSFLDEEEFYGDVVPLLISLSDTQDPQLRVRALQLLAEHSDKRVFPFLLERLGAVGLGQLPENESDAIGHAMAFQNPARAGALFLEWVRPKKLLSRIFGGTTPNQVRHQWVALAGLELLPDLEAEDSVKWLQKRAAGDLAKRCQGCIVRRRMQQELSDV